MNKIIKLKKIILYYDIYKNLLTVKQREIFELYYFDDFSLNEISKIKKLSKSTIQDSLNTTHDLLFNFEKKLNFLEKNIYLKSQIGLLKEKKILLEEFISNINNNFNY